jgi:hypothetical protein
MDGPREILISASVSALYNPNNKASGTFDELVNS